MIFSEQSVKGSVFTLAISLLLLLIGVSVASFLWANLPARAAPTTPLELTADEVLWLAEHPTVRVAFDGNFPPYSMFDDEGEWTGIAIDTLALIARKLNVEFTTSHKTLWKEIYQAGLDREVDIIASMVDREHRREHFLFSQPYIFKSMAVIVHNDNNTIRSRAALEGKTVALVSQYQYTTEVLEEFPNITPYYVDKMIDAMISVETKKADAAIIYLAAGMYLQKKYHLHDIKFAAHYDQSSANESIAVRSDWPIMQSILDKSLASITAAERAQLYAPWQTQLAIPVDYSLLKQVAAVAVALIAMLLIWLYQARRQTETIRHNEEKLFNANRALSSLKDSLEDLVLERTVNLAKSEKKYRDLVENLKDEYFFYRRNCDGQYVYVSPSITKILGFSVEYFLQAGQEIFDSNIVNKTAKTLLERNHIHNDTHQVEIELTDSAGSPHQFKVVETVSRNADADIVGVEGIAQEITHLKKAQAQLHWLSYYDDLTQLANRRLFLIQFEQCLASANRNNEPVALLFLDIDRFKMINDNIGHLAGDLVLTETANRIKSVLRESDIPSRIGGDEFTVILPATDAKAAKRVSSKLASRLAEPFVVVDNHYVLGCSIGIALYPVDGTDANTLIKQADSAMYVAKRNRKGIAFCNSDQLLQSSRQMQLEQKLRTALAAADFSDDFELQAYYQAKIDLSSNQIIGYEALMRWQSPDFGTVSPVEFIAIAEEAGLIGLLSRWMVKKVCLQILAWQRQGFDFGKVAINISAVELLDKNLSYKIIHLLDELGVAHHQIELEVTESALVKAPEVAVKILAHLHQAKILVAIDDFGTGYSSLSYLKSLPASYIKIDRSFIASVTECTEDQEVVRAIIAMSHALGKKVIAEGVETPAQLAFLRREHCDIAQGYYFSKPITAAAVQALSPLTVSDIS